MRFGLVDYYERQNPQIKCPRKTVFKPKWTAETHKLLKPNALSLDRTKQCAVLRWSCHYKATDKATVSRRWRIAKWTSLKWYTALSEVSSAGEKKTAHSRYIENCQSNKQHLHTTLNVETAYQAEELIPDHLVHLCLAHCHHAEPETKGPVLGPMWCWERERHRHRHRQTGTDRDRETETDRQRQTDR